MQKSVFLNVKGLTIEECIYAMGEELKDYANSVFHIHQYSFHNTMELRNPGKLLTGQGNQPVMVVNMTVLLVQSVDFVNKKPADPMADLTPGLKKQLQYASSFLCDHNTDGQPVLEDEDGKYAICIYCNSKVRNLETD